MCVHYVTCFLGFFCVLHVLHHMKLECQKDQCFSDLERMDLEDKTSVPQVGT